LESLKQAATIGDMDQIEKLIAAIRPHSPDIADTLAEFADNFEYNAILRHLSGLPPAQE
jgi:hypothetical protein